MEKPVYASKIDERAKICHILHSTLHSIAPIELLEELSLPLRPLCYKQLPSVADDAVPSRIELADHEFDLLSLVFAKVFLISVRHQAGRDEYSRLLDHDA